MTNQDLVLLAQRGDRQGMALLLLRHEAYLYATAMQMLRRREDAKDAVQDTFLIAVQKITQVREPAAVGPWLAAVLRNVCRMRIRQAATERHALAAWGDRPLPVGSSQEGLEGVPMADWIGPVLASMPEALRVTLILRHFGKRNSYEQIAALLDVPVGTVRSRLAAGRARVAALLTAGVVEPDPELKARQTRLEHFYRESTRMQSPRDVDRFVAHFTPDLILYRPGSPIHRGRRHWQRELMHQLEHGALASVDGIVTSGSISTVEMRFHNAPEFPDHCPPGGTFVFWHQGTQTQRIHGYMDPWPRVPAGA